MNLLSVDYETYYDVDYSLSKMTTEAYVRDPRFEVIGVAVSVNDGPSRWLEEPQWRAFVGSFDWNALGVLHHHAHFDGLITSHHYGKIPGFYFDTLSMARALHGTTIGNSLATLVEKYGLGHKGREVENVRGMHRADFSPEAYARYGAYSINDNDLTRALFKKLAARFPRTSLEDIDILIRMFTDPVLRVDEGKLGSFLLYETKKKEELLARCGLTAEDLLSADKFAVALAEVGIEAPMKPSPTDPKKLIYAFAKTDPQFQALAESPDDEVRILAEARLALKSTGNESRTRRLLAMGAGGRSCPVYLKYYGAHVGRPSGGDSMNWTNFQRVGRKDPMKGMIRKSIVAPPGKKIVVADWGQIQARINAWLSGQDDVTAQFREGEDVYSIFASAAYGRPINRKTDPDGDITGQVGKACVLGLGFGMGNIKLGTELLKGANGGPVVQFTRADMEKLSIDPSRYLSNPSNIEKVKALPSRLELGDRLIHFAVTNHFVNIYRAKNRAITALWPFAEKMVREIASGRYGPCFYLGCLKKTEEGFLLPNGMTLRYPHLEVSEDSISYLSGKNQRTHLYGGKIVENIVISLEAVIATRAMRSLRNEYLKGRGGRIALFAYDEIGVCIDEDYAGECLNTMTEIMKRPLEWAPGLPLAVEGDIGDSYGEVK